MQVLHILTDMAPDTCGLCALSAGRSDSGKDSDSYLAYPGAGGHGQVQIFNAVSLVGIHFIM
jgi:hypothetical protein